MTPQEILIAARAKIADEANWCKGALARDINGDDKPDSHEHSEFIFWEGLQGNDPMSCRWCALGAVQAVIGDDHIPYAVRSPLEKAARNLFQAKTIADLNDGLGHVAVMQCYDAAIKMVGETP